MISTIATLKQIYPKHVLIQLELPHHQSNDPELTLNRVDLNRLCVEPIERWLSDLSELAVKSSFPCWLSGSDNLKFISTLVNGFVLEIGATRIVFIPSDTLDLEEFEVPQEWVDLPNWAASYYVPIRVDLEQQYLHLWGFIDRAALKDRATLDRVFRNYQIAAAETIDNLDLLRENCELDALEVATSDRSLTPSVEMFSPPDLASVIHQLHQRNSHFSPRLDLPFSHWGAILNEPKWLESYLSLEPEISIITKPRS